MCFGVWQRWARPSLLSALLITVLSGLSQEGHVIISAMAQSTNKRQKMAQVNRESEFFPGRLCIGFQS